MPSPSNVGSKRRRGSSGASRLQRGGAERLASRERDVEPEEQVAERSIQGDHETSSGEEDEPPTSSTGIPPAGSTTKEEVQPGPARHVYGSGISAQDFMVSDDDSASDHPSNEGVEDARTDGEDGSDDEDMSADEEELEAILADEEDGLYPSEGTETSPFSTAPIVYPRRLYRGARNVETVKDVTFLGAEKNFIGSGSDDGNFFVWSKEGKLEGIWEGDSAVVNVIEQHPSLPLCAVSGIDSTVKVGHSAETRLGANVSTQLFAPLHKPPPVSFKRIQNAENIIRANTQSDRQRGLGGRMALLSSYARFLASNGGAGLVEVEGDGEGLRDCALQ